MKKYTIISLSLATLLASCSPIPKEAYDTRGQPESLLEVSSEQVTINLAQYNGLGQLANAVNNQSPSSAELVCSNTLLCDRAAELLDNYNIPYQQVNGSGNAVTLNFQSIVAKDCENRFISNHINPYNLNHPTFGCSVALNQVQMVSDKRQFVDPALLGEYDGEKATQNYDTYLSRDPVVLEREKATQQ